MKPTRKTSYWYHEIYEAIPVIVKLKQVVMPYIEFIQDSNKTNKIPSRFKGYADTNPHLSSEHNNQIILGKIENTNHYEYVEDESY